MAADGRLLESVNLRIREASLTGESYSVDKTPQVLDGEDVSLGNRRNMVYMGTQVTYGQGTAVVIGTGMGTEQGRIIELNSDR